jgi:hypothetical protein
MARSYRLRRPRSRPSATAAAAGVLLVALLVAAFVQVVVAQANVLARDTYSRTVSSGWGSADVGGAWTVSGTAANWAVSSGTGRMTLPAQGATRSAALSGVSVVDVDLLVSVTADSAASGSGLYLYTEARYRDAANQYRGKIRIAADGSVYLHASRVTAGTQAAVGSEVVVPGLSYTPGTPIWVRAQFTGTSPTTIRLRAWTGATEPSGWTYTGTDSSAALQTAGAIGLRGFLAANAKPAPVTVTWDELTLSDPNAPPPIVAPVANFTVACSDLSCAFTDTSSGDPTSWSWDFGDDTTASTADVTHDYALPGSYTVSLTASNAAGSDSHEAVVVAHQETEDVLVQDSFQRSATSDWGSADVGGRYRLVGSASSFSVAGGEGVMVIPSGATRAAWLDVAQADVDVRFQVRIGAAPAGNGTYVYGLVRRIDDKNGYRPKVRLASDGVVWLHASVVLNGVETSLAPPMRARNVTAAPNVPLMVRMRAVGTDPTMIRVKVWQLADPEPDEWGFSITDDTPALQKAGTVGVQVYQSSGTAGQQRAYFDELRIVSAPGGLPADDATLVGAGDIASCSSSGDEGTAALLDGVQGTVFAAGDLVYQNGTATEFASCYDPSWGRHQDRTLPVPGNHEYHTAGAAGYFGYWGLAAGDPQRGYYATTVGGWRVYVLNSECGQVSCSGGSTQETWLRSDLAANLTPCSVAIMHRPRFSSGGEHGNDASVQPLWQALYDARVELVVSGHDHNYERFAPQTPTGAANPGGIREFVVGTGGSALRPMGVIKPNSVVRQATSHGVLRLTLEDRSYDWAFLKTDGPAFTDQGSGTCR